MMTSSLEFLDNDNENVSLIKEISTAKVKASYNWRELRSGLLKILMAVYRARVLYVLFIYSLVDP